jgi:hypothetical protein
MLTNYSFTVSIRTNTSIAQIKAQVDVEAIYSWRVWMVNKQACRSYVK